jgi:hypothetical protein
MNCARIYNEGLAINSVMLHLPAAYSKSLVLDAEDVWCSLFLYWLLQDCEEQQTILELEHDSPSEVKWLQPALCSWNHCMVGLCTGGSGGGGDLGRVHGFVVVGFTSVEGVHHDCDCDCFTGELDVLPLKIFSGDKDTDEAFVDEKVLDEVQENSLIKLSDVECKEEWEDEKEYVEECSVTLVYGGWLIDMVWADEWVLLGQCIFFVIFVIIILANCQIIVGVLSLAYLHEVFGHFQGR